MAKENLYMDYYNKALDLMFKEFSQNPTSPIGTKISMLNSTSFFIPARKAVNRTRALLLFKNVVGEKKIWDHKPALKRVTLKVTRPDGAPAFATPMLGDDTYWYDHDFWSNMHYGYIGLALGFTELELTYGNRLFGGATDSGDLVSIPLGYKLFNEVGLNIGSKSQFHNFIFKNREKWNGTHVRFIPSGI